MATNHVQPGARLTYTNGGASDIASGDVVVVGSILGVAIVDIAVGATGELATTGVFSLPKVAATAFTSGEPVIWDDSAGEFVGSGATPEAGDVSACCIAWADAASAATVADIKLNVGVGTVT